MHWLMYMIRRSTLDCSESNWCLLYALHMCMQLASIFCSLLQVAMGVFSDLPAFEIQWLARQVDGVSLLGSAYKVTMLLNALLAMQSTMRYWVPP